MDTPGYVVLSRLGAQLRATAAIANNLANADTPGFRAERAIFTPAPQTDRDAAATVRGGGQVAYALDRATWRDTAPGALQVTNNPLDMAIRGDGFFAVETPRGERFTRAGRFTLDADRRLVDADNNAVLNTNGAPITFAANDTRLEVRGDGTIRSENGVVARLRIVRFADPQALLAEGSRLFAASADPEPVERPAVIGGALEAANVSAVSELARMINETREFGFVATFAEREGDRIGTAVERILRRRS